MFLWKRRNDLQIANLIKGVIVRLDDLDRKVTTMASVANAKLDQIKDTLVTAGAGINVLIENNKNLGAAVEQLRSEGADVSKIEEVYAVSTGIAATVAAALNPTVPTPPVEELPSVTPLPDLPPNAGEGVTPVPETSDPIADIPAEAPVAETPATDAPAETPAASDSDSAGSSDTGTATDGGSTDSTTS